jgi:long-subunit fatty acid transport protein
MKYFHTLIIFLFLSSHSGFSQDFDLGTWNILNLRYNLNEKVSFFGEGQLRSLKFYNHYHYYEYKGGISVRANNNLQLTLGAGSYQTHKEGGDFILPKNNNELRIWPQVILNQSLGAIKIEQRYRAELRFTSNGYRNRFRYRLGLSYPFGRNRGTFKPFLVSASNELFFTNNEPYFERNRVAFGLGYKPTSATSLQIGYLHQFDYRINDETGRDFLQVGYFVELFRK